MRHQMFEVWLSKGQGLVPGPRFRVLEDAVRHAEENRESASYAIRKPFGGWYEWPVVDGAILPRRANPSACRAIGGELRN